MNRSIFLLTTVLGTIPLCDANDLSSLYPAATLNSWTQRYQRSSTKILDEIIWPVLFENEKALFGGRKPVLEFPLPPKVIDDARGNPLAFYSFGDRDLVVFPVLSLKFLDDLCTAYAWLQTNGYGLETISEYTAILRYGSPPAGGFPAPLDALGIPQNALNDADVNDLALGHFVTARTFILLHEMGHILEARSNSISADPIQNEEWADRFAATIMQRTPLRPLGMVIYFLANAHWSSYSASASDTHPLSGKRVLTLASRMDDPVLAMKLRELGVKFFDDPLVRQGFAATGQGGNFQALAPRRPNELPRLGTIQRSGNSVAFDGLYRGQFVQFSDPTEAMEIEVSLRRTRDNVTGHYTFGLGVGTLSGTAVGNHLYFEWQWGQNFGKGVFEARGGNSFAGTWGYRESRTNAGTWNGSHQ